jgi:serine/threonine protein kinase
MSKVFTITEGLENMGALRTGGQGSVYKGRRMGPILSAVKLLPTPIHTEDEGDRNFRNFQNEVEKLKKVNEEPCPNVVKILNSGLTESGSFPFIEMEYIEGPDLEDLLKPPHEKIFTIREVIKLADHLSNALAHCHKVGVKHGDIKSNNVKYNIHSGNYMLLDFGLAIMSDEQRRTSIRHAGAIEFMAPEQNTGSMLFQTDVYSFGIILYELLGGQVPFPLPDSGETSRNTVMIAHMESEVPDLQKLRKINLPETWFTAAKKQEAKIPAWLLDVVNKCLEKDPKNRFKDGMELQEAIVSGSLANNKVVVIEKVIEQVPVEVISKPITQPAAPVNIQNNSGIIRIAKPTFFGLMGLLLLSMATTGYLLFNNDKNVKPLTTVVKDSLTTPKDTTPQVPVRYNENKKAKTDSATQKAIDDAIERDRQKASGQPNTDSLNNLNDTTAKQPVN